MRVAVSRVVPANDATKTAIMAKVNFLEIPMVIIIFADPSTKALIFDPKPAAAAQDE
ncbi:hypothetical protein ES705_50077 [subsurface metagenome]